MRRRSFLSAAAGAIPSTALLIGRGSATTKAWRSENVSEKDISHEYDEQFLKRHRPMFVADQETRRKYHGLYGYKVTSPAYDYDYAYYWSRLSHQDGLPLVRKDAHLGDHEPIICVVSDDGLDSVIWTGYHHYAARSAASGIQVVADETADRTHPVFEIDSRWHNYYETESDAWTRGDYPLENWLAARDSWIENGFYERTSAAAIEDPEVMHSRDTWWSSGVDREMARIWGLLGFGGIERSENIEL